MVVPNLYWPVYKNLEKEFLELANFIHIDDDQLDIYSMHIADLIVRCAVEIEAISKELYKNLGGNMSPVDNEGKPRDLYFDTDCLNLLDQHWILSKKKITISAATVYLIKPENTIILPLHKAFKRGTSGSKWKQAYQAVKHDRKESLKSATIRNLLYALGALYILNLYYKDERIDIGRVYLGDNDFDSRAGSEIFSTFSYKATSLSVRKHLDDNCILTPNNQIDESIFIVKYDDKSIREMHKNFCLDAEITEQRFANSPIIANYLATHPEDSGLSINEICMKAGGINLLQTIICFDHAREEKSSRTEAVLNKHSSIYPELSPLDQKATS